MIFFGWLRKKPANDRLWRGVSVTKPSATREVSYGSRKFTAIDAYSQVHRATIEWGPYGGAWGLRNLSYELIREQTVLQGVVVDQIIQVSLQCEFIAPGIRFPVASEISHKLEGDSKKKLLTDCLTKSLSYLGFNADVFLGKYDDNKYVQMLRERENGGKAAAPPKPKAVEPAPSAQSKPTKADAVDEFAEINTVISKFSQPTRDALNELVDKEIWSRKIVREVVQTVGFDEAKLCLYIEKKTPVRVKVEIDERGNIL